MSSISQLKKQLKQLNAEYAKIKDMPAEKRADFGKKLNAEKLKIMQQIADAEAAVSDAPIAPLDISAPRGINANAPTFFTADAGSKHPLMVELDRVISIYQSMGFDIMESCQLDDEYHMFDSLNFAKGHPARDGYDSFRTEEGFIPPAHTSTMQNRVLKAYKYKLDADENGIIAVAVPGRVYRNEDVDATHEHTFYQCEGVYVSKDCTLGNMLGILREFFEKYYNQKLDIKTQPGYFPFTEPSLELLIEKPKTLGGKGGDWLEMLGCGMIHPNVLKMAGIDPTKFQGFAWGGGIDRLAMLRYDLNDVRHFEAAKLDFLKEFAC